MAAPRSFGENSPLSEFLRVKIVAANKETYGDVIRCVTEHCDARITVALDHAHALQLPIGRPIVVHFPPLAKEASVSVTGRVVARSEDTRGINYEVLFPRAAAGTLSALVNRRSALRVHPAADHPVRVVLRAFAGATELKLEAIDISAAGIALRVSPSLEARLAAARKVELVIQLPDGSEPFRLAGFILRRRLVGAHVQYGIHFEEKGTLMQREAIQRWALMRQGTGLRHAG